MSDDLFELIESNEVEEDGKEAAASVSNPSFTGEAISPKKSLLERALDSLDPEEENEPLTLKELMSPRSDEPEVTKLKSAKYTTKIYVLTLRREDADDTDNIRYEEIINSSLSGEQLLVREEWYDLKGREAVKVILKVLIPKKKGKKNVQ